MKIEMMIVKLLKKLEARWFANGDQQYYNDDLRKLLLGDEWILDEDIDDIMWFFENVLLGDEFDVQAIVDDFIDNHNNDKHINFLSNLNSILLHVNSLAQSYN